MKTTHVTTIALAGFGAIGQSLAGRLREMPDYELAAVAARDEAKALSNLSALGYKNVPVRAVGDLADLAEVIVECAPAAIFPDIAVPAIKAGRKLVVLSSGALLDNWHLVGLAADSGASVLVPSGALLGLDAVQAAAQGNIESVRLTSRKPPGALIGAPYLRDAGISLESLDGPRLVFEGTAREAVRGFPANLNVAVALSLAGIGPDRTTVALWADPASKRNSHEVEVIADTVTLRLAIENVPSANAKTGQLTALSVIALLKKLRAPLQVGT
jgi:aspartate dehydrogenase